MSYKSYTVVALFHAGKPQFEFPSLNGVAAEGMFYYPENHPQSQYQHDGAMMTVSFLTDSDYHENEVTPEMLMQAIKKDFAQYEPSFIMIHSNETSSMVAYWTQSPNLF